MTLVVVGINHRSAPQPVLGQLTFSGEYLTKLLTAVDHSSVVVETVVISTCNRTEVYAQAERFHEAYRDITEALAMVSEYHDPQLEQHLYVEYDYDAVEHLFSLAAGLDSAVFGEHEILGQVRRAWDVARAERTSGTLLNLLFQRSVEAGKRVRTETRIGEAAVALPHATVSLVAAEAKNFSQSSALVVGLGDLGSGVARAMSRHGIANLTVANRSHHKAEQLAADIDAKVISFDQINENLDQFDVVVSATGARGHVIETASVAERQSNQPLVVADLAIPRDVPPEVDALDNATVIVLGDVQDHANSGVAQRKKQSSQARKIIVEELNRYEQAKSARSVVPLIGSLHEQLEAIRQGELDRAGRGGTPLTDDERELLDLVTKALVNKVLHEPTVRLKDSAGTVRGQRLADAARSLFDL